MRNPTESCIFGLEGHLASVNVTPLTGYNESEMTASSPFTEINQARGRPNSRVRAHSVQPRAVLDDVSRSPQWTCAAASVKPLLIIRISLLRCELEDTRKIRGRELPSFLDLDQAEPSRLP